MSKFCGFRSEPWTEFSKEADKIIDDDFVKDNILTFKTSHQPARGIVKFKQMVGLKNNKYSMDEEVRIWFPFENLGSSFYTQIKNNQGKIRYDHGVREYGSNLINFYGGLQTEKNFRNTIFKIGANLLFVNTNFNTRLRVVKKDEGKYEISTGHKFNWSTQKWTFDLCNIINYNKLSLLNTTVRLIHNINPNQHLFLKAQNSKQYQLTRLYPLTEHFDCTRFAIDYVHKLNKDTKLALQTKFSSKGVIDTVLVGEKGLDKLRAKVKVKLCMSRMISMSYQTEIKGYGRWVVGWEVSDLGRRNLSKFGLLVDLNL